MICYAVIDTNVLVSALISKNSDAATVQVIIRMFSGEIVPIYSKEIIREYYEVLNRKKIGFKSAMVKYILLAMEKYGLLIEPSPTGIILPDIKDLPFYEVVMEKQDDSAYLVTGNIKHFPTKKFIVTPRQMLDILEEKIENDFKN